MPCGIPPLSVGTDNTPPHAEPTPHPSTLDLSATSTPPLPHQLGHRPPTPESPTFAHPIAGGPHAERGAGEARLPTSMPPISRPAIDHRPTEPLHASQSLPTSTAIHHATCWECRWSPRLDWTSSESQMSVWHRPFGKGIQTYRPRDHRHESMWFRFECRQLPPPLATTAGSPDSHGSACWPHLRSS